MQFKCWMGAQLRGVIELRSKHVDEAALQLSIRYIVPGVVHHIPTEGSGKDKI